MKNIIKLLSILAFISIASTHSHSAETAKLLKTDWSFKGLFGKFDRGSLQRGYQVYTEVCAACHSMKYLSYRNLGEKGGPEFSEAEVKAIAASFEVTTPIFLGNRGRGFFLSDSNKPSSARRLFRFSYLSNNCPIPER